VYSIPGWLHCFIDPVIHGQPYWNNEFLPHSKHWTVSNTKTSSLIKFRELIFVYSMNKIKYKNIIRGQTLRRQHTCSTEYLLQVNYTSRNSSCPSLTMYYFLYVSDVSTKACCPQGGSMVLLNGGKVRLFTSQYGVNIPEDLNLHLSSCENLNSREISTPWSRICERFSNKYLSNMHHSTCHRFNILSPYSKKEVVLKSFTLCDISQHSMVDRFLRRGRKNLT
jgi:hypothetical protein